MLVHSRITNLRQLFLNEAAFNKETFDDIVYFYPDDLNWGDSVTDGLLDFEPCTIWTEKYVYFLATYDGAEWFASVPREPCEVATKHVGC